MHFFFFLNISAAACWFYRQDWFMKVELHSLNTDQPPYSILLQNGQLFPAVEATASGWSPFCVKHVWYLCCILNPVQCPLWLRAVFLFIYYLFFTTRISEVDLHVKCDSSYWISLYPLIKSVRVCSVAMEMAQSHNLRNCGHVAIGDNTYISMTTQHVNLRLGLFCF